MDAPGHPPALVAGSLDDLRRVNRALGGVRLTLVPLERLAAGVPRAAPLRVLDVATGGADIPRALTASPLAADRRLFVVASDVSEPVLRLARERPGRGRPLPLVVADARRLPFVTRGFHAVTCSLALHHMLPHDAEAMLREMGRCASVGVVVNDLVRNWVAYAGAVLLTRLGTRNLLVRHDGPLSVRKAYTKKEMAALAARAGLRPVRWDGFLFYRLAMTAAPARDV